jgi:DNA-3-methyladenine glycosylase I
MDQPTTYCDFAARLEPDNPHRHYHDNEYGFALTDDDALFGLLVLEINQAGLSWTTILKKKDNFRKAYDEFRIEKVAAYGEEERQRLLGDAGIIRNRLKVDAAIENARRILELRKEFGSFKGWLDHHHPKTREEWTKLFRKTFKFTGGEIVNEFLMSSGYLPGAHVETCPAYRRALDSGPAWAKQKY